MVLVETCSECYHFKKWNNGGAEYNFENIYVDPTSTAQATKIFYQPWKREIIYDKGSNFLKGTKTDGTYSDGKDRWITRYYPHFA